MLVSKSYDVFDTLRLFDDLYFGSNFSTRGFSSRLTSPYRIETSEKGLNLSIDLPGVKSNDLSVKMTGRELTVSGKVRDNEFKYSYRISKEYNPDSIDASLEDGVLTLTFNKNEEEKTKTVNVKIR